MRHSKAAYPDNATDHQRPLASRGRNDAPQVGAWLAKQGWVPDLVVCSDAARTIETATLVLEGLGSSLTPTPVAELYEAGISAVLDVVAGTDPRVATLLVVGHEPVMSATTRVITGKYAHFPTSAIAKIELDGGWADVGANSGTLLAVRTP
jgi:phosphohistidine phosphatase